MFYKENHAEHENLTPGRLEAFSDGVLAIIITITVLEFKIPAGSDILVLKPMIPLFIAYAISFQSIGTYWNNHHNLLRTTRHISTDVMWANINLLFWLSFIPFATGWVGANHGGSWPTALYASILFAAGVSYNLLQYAVVRHADQQAEIMATLKQSKKGIFSLTCYLVAVFAAFLNPIISDILIFVVALLWFIPDRRIAKFIN
ncbi:MAG: TMEM175 family protein [Candidatus Pacebacteria bacterium]|nr:TMEM175 family protein [Candidatus Paceibacterota bacterium]